MSNEQPERLNLMGQSPSISTGIPLVEARNIKKYFPIRASVLGKLLARQRDLLVKAVDDVSLKIWSGETVGLVGESGCGKTTLGRVMTRLHEPTAGQLFFRNQPVRLSSKIPTLRSIREKPCATLLAWPCASVA
jgi:ABC-type oligopeptide transport system ATPase subunit